MSKIEKKVMPAMKLSGLEPFSVTADVGLVSVLMSQDPKHSPA